MGWPTTRFVNAANNGSFTHNTVNGIQDQYVRPTGILADDLDATTIAVMLGLVQTASAVDGAAVRRGSFAKAGADTTTSTSYVAMATPDRVSGIVLPTNGLIVIGYRALWSYANGVPTTNFAAVHLGGIQLQKAGTNAYVNDEASLFSSTIVSSACLLMSSTGGLANSSNTAGPVSHAATGQLLGVKGAAGGLMFVRAAAGTYTVDIRFKNTAGNTLGLSNRTLNVWTIGF